MKRTLFFFGLGISFLIAGCAPDAGGPGPRTWIDAPLDGSTVESGPVVVRSHAASEGGTSQAVLLVNGDQVRQDAAADPTAPLVEFAQTWQPTSNGEYTLQVVATDHEGNEGRSNTVRVIVGQPPLTETGTPSPVFTMTPFTPTMATVTATLTVVAQPEFSFDQNANCREGDSIDYEVVTAFNAGDTVPIEGRNEATTWFRVPVPGSNAHCWIASSTGRPTGPFNSVQVIVPPPPPVTDTPTTPPQQAPAAPSQLSIIVEVCNAQEYSVMLGWVDNATNESGYRLYRDGQLIATLGAGANSYTDSPPDLNAHTYMVEAFNDAGAAPSNSVQEDGCLF